MCDPLPEIDAALAEDIGGGDLTGKLLPAQATLSVEVITRDAGVIAGRPWFDGVFQRLHADIHSTWQVEEGQTVTAGTVLARLYGPARALLAGERTALNFLQLLCGTATLTRRYVDRVSGTGAVILDTRKTIPGLRHAQKYAVRMGGGQNHRLGLFDAILIKENHIAAAGGITSAITAAQQRFPEQSVEIEVETLADLALAVQAGADRALLDNFAPADLVIAATRYRDLIELEASGGITLENIQSVAVTGVHFISVGALTKRIEPLDLSMRFV